MASNCALEQILSSFLPLQVDGFRFDIMSCLMVSTMEKARDALRALTLERDGVDGAKLYLYGEGWDHGEVGQGSGYLMQTAATNAAPFSCAHFAL